MPSPEKLMQTLKKFSIPGEVVDAICKGFGY